MQQKSIIIIGSGIAGIASAIRLKAMNFNVIVFEANSSYGGKLGVLEKEGFRWDMGPSLFTLPSLVDELFSLSCENPKDFFSYEKQDISCNYFWKDGTQFNAKTDPSAFAAEASQLFNESKENILNYLERSKVKYDLTAPLFLDQSLHKWKTYLSREALKAISHMPKLDLYKNLHQVNANAFQNEKLIQLFDRYATYNGSSPFQTPGIMSMIPTLEMHHGTYFPKGGMRSIATQLFQLAVRKGVQFNFNEKVKEIILNQQSAKGVITNKGKYKSDVVISNMDVHYSYSKLLPTVKSPKKIMKQEKSSSAIIFYWGIKKEFKELGLHNIIFSDNYKEEFDFIFNKKALPPDPTIYINVSSKANSEDAPIGKENWFVMVNTPSNSGQDWELLVQQAKSLIIQKLNTVLNVQLQELIEFDSVLDPVKIELNTSSHQGALYGSSSNSKFAAFLRQANQSSTIKNLFFCGGSVHPGGGIPLCLKSAKITTDLIADVTT